MSRELEAELKGRVTRLMQFLRELVVARSKPVRQMSGHEKVLWLETPPVAYVEDAIAGDVLLRAERVTLDPAPDLPPLLHGWIDVRDRDDSTGGDPPLRDHGPAPLAPQGDRRTVPLEEAPEVTATYAQWLPVWRHWAEGDRHRRPRYALYETLRVMRQALTERPESVEVVLAAGLLDLPASTAGERIEAHLLTQPAEVVQDRETGDLICRLTADSAPRLEDSQLLTGLRCYDPSGTTYLRSRLLETVPSTASAEVTVFLKEWAQRALTVPVEVGETDDPAGPSTLTPAPALVLRRRGAFALIDYYDQMIAAAEDPEEPVPLGLAQLVEAIEPTERLEWLERTGATAAADLATDPLFPLPANAEQAQIIERLGGDSGVVVEGPPGTGKTHTIANLVSALLARGQRVLVTSEKAQALRVLRDKLPAEMQELCVSITDVARGGSTELNRSVATLASRKSGFHSSVDDARIVDLDMKRRQARSERARVLEEIRSLRESETYVHPEVAPGYAGTAAAIARAVRAGEERHGWLPLPASGQPPLSAPEMRELRDLLAMQTQQRLSRRDQVLPTTEALPDLHDVRRLCAQARCAPEAVGSEQVHHLTRALTRCSEQDLLTLTEECQRLGAALGRLRQPSMPPWAVPLCDDVLAGRNAHLWARAQQITSLAEHAVAADRVVGTAAVEAPVESVPAAARAFRTFAQHLQEGGSLKRMFKSDAQKAVEQWLPQARVDGQAVTSAEQAWKVTAHLDALDIARTVADLLAPLGAALPQADQRPLLVSAVDAAGRAVNAVADTLAARDRLAEHLAKVVPDPPPMFGVDAAEEVARAATALTDAHVARLALGQLQRLAETLAQSVQERRPPELDALLEALHRADAEGAASATGEMADARRQQAEQARCDDLLRRLEAGAPGLSRALQHDPTAEVWDTRLDGWDTAWAWACAATWLANRRRPGHEHDLDGRLQTLEADIAHVTAQLAAARAWKDALTRMTAQQVQALQAYRDALANIGKGTGKYAERFRQAARSAMAVAQGAVPAWVMPLQQVLATIPPQQNAFDVIIVDEASQADLSSLFLLWLAPRVIVVGDDRQCTPSEVSAGALDAVFERLDAYLPDMPLHLRATLTPRSSVFSTLRTRFGQVVRLREHYRCMPEIITWSSQMFYRDAPLVPVRQFGADRLPPLRTTYVEGAYTEGRYATLRNPVEAEAIVEALQRCLNDPAYDGKTLGVVVLQGQSQVEVITNALLRRLEPEIWEERRLRVGTPPDFQGDERHVVFLSMVVSPDLNFATLTKNEYQRRFNVAASRAQDQLWLFHSVTPDRLNRADLRHSLLTYMSTVSPAPVAAIPDRVSRDVRHPAFDSLFEQRVFLDLTARGYHVTPQVEVNHRRIDLVVTGSAAKLAVECDGDAWHTTPEQRDADLARELELKRCGWTFWRVRESEYYLDPERALSSLWAELDRRGIAPFAAELAGAAQEEPGEAWSPAALPDDESPLEEEREIVADQILADYAPLSLGAPSAQPAPARTIMPSPAPPLVSSASFGEWQAHRDAVLSAAAAGPVTNPMVRSLVHVTDGEARALLQALVAEGVLERRGQARGTYYVLPGREPAPVRPLLPEVPRYAVLAEHREAVVRQAATYGRVTNEDVRRITGLDQQGAFRLLRSLVDDGLLEQRGSKRGSHYVLTQRGPEPPGL